MISGMNDSKKSFLIWTIITTLLLIIMFIFGYYDRAYVGFSNEIINEISAVIPANISKIIVMVALPFLFASFPIGVGFKKCKIGNKYIHVPTEELQVLDISISAMFKLIQCEIIIVIDIVLFALSILFCIIIGPFAYLYTLISGIVLWATKKI